MSARSARNRRVIGAEHVDLVGQPVGGVEQLAVDVELALVPRAVADAHRCAVAPAGQVRELALGQVVLAADAEHDLAGRDPRRTSDAAASQAKSKNLLASCGQAATHSAWSVNDASRTHV